MEESWLPVSGYEGYYEVSSHGSVRSVPRTTSHGRKWQGRILSPGTQGPGYLTVTLSKENKQKTFFVHALVLESFVGPRPEGLVCRHLDDNPSNNYFENLRWDTQKENIQDILRSGNHKEARKTHCLRGHPLQEPNLGTAGLKKGVRDCLSCSRATNWVHYYPEDRVKIQEVSDRYYKKILNQ